MKTKFMYVSLAAMMLAGLNSCSNDNNAVDNGETKSVYLKLSNPETRTAEAPVTSANAVTFNDGYLYFTDISGKIIKHYTISSGATSATNLNITTLTGTGETLTGLSASIHDTYVVGNTSNLTMPTSGNISVVQALMVAFNDQTPLTGPGSTTNLYGTAGLAATATPGVYTSSVTIAPTVARIELPSIQAAATSLITAFTVDGIFVDGYYKQAQVDGTINVADLEALSLTAADFTALPSTKYPVTYDGILYDLPATAASGAPLAVRPPVAWNVWGYNMFADNTGSVIPHIVIQLSGVTATGLSFTDPQFLTIKGLLVGGLPTAFTAGNVYSIVSGLTFDETNLTPVPNLTSMDIIVDVTVANWAVITVDADI